MSRIHECLSELGIEIDPQLLELAFTHRSYSYENGLTSNNERLEFLGDAVLGIAVTEFLYVHFPEFPEGQLAKLRSAVVNSFALADVARELGLGESLRLGRGEASTGGADKSSILADALEAVIGAVHMSAGRASAERFVHHLFDPLVDRAATLGAGLDWKTSLQELCASVGLEVPRYVVESSGPDHDKRFEASVVVGGTQYPSAEGRSKKQAEQGAAQAAFEELASGFAE